MSSSKSVLDLSRRRVAAISFLANISTDDTVSEIKLDCLQGTNVLRDFQRNKRQRQAHFAALHESNAPPILHLKELNDRAAKRETRISIPRKLTYFNADDAENRPLPQLAGSKTGDAAERREEHLSDSESKAAKEEEKDDVPMLLMSAVSPKHGRTALNKQEDNLLHLDLSKAKGDGESMPKSAPLPAASTEFLSVAAASSKGDRGNSSSSEVLSSIPEANKGHAKRKLAYYSKPHDIAVDGSSNESLATGARLRKISGNPSESSGGAGSNFKEIRYCRGDEERSNMGGGDERLVFVSSEHKVPFAISSVISFSKPQASKVTAHRGEKDGQKRMRSNSGNRPLSSINDTFDPLDIIGMERADDGQPNPASLAALVSLGPLSRLRRCSRTDSLGGGDYSLLYRSLNTKRAATAAASCRAVASSRARNRRTMSYGHVFDVVAGGGCAAAAAGGGDGGSGSSSLGVSACN